MTLKITDRFGNSIDYAISKMLSRINSKLNNSGSIISNSLTQTTRRHFQTIYPGSKHYSPDKVNPGSSSSRTGETVIDVPGVTRAYHDIDIVPKFRKYLTIPISKKSYGRKSSEFNNTFITFKKDGRTGLIGQKSDTGSVVWLYRLVKHVHQNQDSNLLPSDDTYATNIFGRISAYINNLNS